MVRLLKFLVWTGCAFGLGVYLSTAQFGGQTPVQHAERTWRRSVPPSAVDEAWASVKATVQGLWGEGEPPKASRRSEPKEHHSADDKDAVERLIAKQAEKGNQS